jgi:hypothetical protein
MQHPHAFVLEQRPDLGEEFPIMIDPHMLEHPDRDDAVELVLDLPVIEQVELDVPCDAALLGALIGEFVLLFRQCHASHLRSAHFCEVKSKPAPA